MHLSNWPYVAPESNLWRLRILPGTPIVNSEAKEVLGAGGRDRETIAVVTVNRLETTLELGSSKTHRMRMLKKTRL